MVLKNDYPGHLILIVSVPGGGKSTLIKSLRDRYKDIKFAVSCTSRLPRPGEVDGDVYYFLSPEDFKVKIDNKDFLEWIQQDGGRYYGTLKSEIVDRIKEGEIVVREVEIRGVRSIRELIPKRSLSVIFIVPGSWDEVKNRMLKRAPMSNEELLHRKLRFEDELKFAAEADYVIKNPDGGLEEAKKELFRIVDSIISSNNT